MDELPGGVPNTLYRSGEQWDFPNVWPPMQYILIEGLDNLGTENAKDLSKKWGHRWVKSNFKAYSDTRAMFEKVREIHFTQHLLERKIIHELSLYNFSTTLKRSESVAEAASMMFRKDLAGPMALL